MKIDTDKLRQLHAATTQGEWWSNDGFVWGGQPTARICDCTENAEDTEGATAPEADALFIAEAHNAMPALLDELDALRDFVQSVVNSYDDTGCDGCGVVDESINGRALRLLDDEPAQEANPGIVTWQTGRWYSRMGQRIAAIWVEADSALYFSDVDRCISGSVACREKPVSIEKFVMWGYDENLYTAHIPLEIREMLDKEARKVEAPQ